MESQNSKIRSLWRRVFQHTECMCDVHLLDGTIYHDITHEKWGKLHFGHIGYYREVDDDRTITNDREYSSDHIIDKVVFRCSNCRKEKKCPKTFKKGNRRVEG